jgi:N-methylhydantoinase B
MDPVFLSLLNGQLQQVVDEMDAVLSRQGGGVRARAGAAVLHAVSGEIQWQSRQCSPAAAGAMAVATSQTIVRMNHDSAHTMESDGGIALVRPFVSDDRPVCFLAAVQDSPLARRRSGPTQAFDHGMPRLAALSGIFGAARLRSGMDALAARAADAVRGIVAELPDGRWSADDWLDNDGVEDRPLKVALDLDISGANMVLDFSRSAGASAGPVNIPRTTTVAACRAALCHVLGGVPGDFAAVRVVVADGSLLAAGSADVPAAALQTVLRVGDVVLAALAAALPQGAVAPGIGAMSEVMLRGRVGDVGDWLMPAVLGGGHGAVAGGDGANVGSAPFVELPSSEVLEATHPVLVSTCALRPDSGGAGRYRGGLGAVYELEVRAPQAEAGVIGDRGKYGPPGVRGGRPGAAHRILWWDGGVKCDPPLVSKLDGLKLVQGQRLRLETPGGGGYGRAREREPAAVAEDVRLGYVTARAAEREYAVVVDAEGVLDAAATRKLRGS